MGWMEEQAGFCAGGEEKQAKTPKQEIGTRNEALPIPRLTS